MLKRRFYDVLKQRFEREFYEPLRMQIGQSAVLAQKAAAPSFSHLWDAEIHVFSQWGEDGILEYLCESLDIVKPKMLELGAGNFLECNSRFLAEQRNASVVAVDYREDLIDSMRSLPLYWRTSLFPIKSWITPESAPLLLAEAEKMMGGVDIVSLDIDGNDYWVVETLNLDEVKIVIVEYNALLGHLHPVSIPRDDHFNREVSHSSCLYYGASLRAWVHLLETRGFSFAGTNRVGCNAFFVESESVKSLSIEIPPTGDLSPYTDWRVRESRDESGKLSYLAGSERAAAISHLPLTNVVTGATITVLVAHSPESTGAEVGK